MEMLFSTLGIGRRKDASHLCIRKQKRQDENRFI